MGLFALPHVVAVPWRPWRVKASPALSALLHNVPPPCGLVHAGPSAVLVFKHHGLIPPVHTHTPLCTRTAPDAKALRRPCV